MSILTLCKKGVYKECVHGYKESKKSLVSHSEHARLFQKSLYLEKFLDILGSAFPNPISLIDAYKETIKHFSNTPQTRKPIKRERTIRDWFTNFCKHRMFFVHQIENELNGITKLPPLLDKYPELVDSINNFMQNNIGEVSVSRLHEHVEKCLLVLLKDEIIDLTKDDDNSMSTIESDDDNIVLNFESDSNSDSDSDCNNKKVNDNDNQNNLSRVTITVKEEAKTKILKRSVKDISQPHNNLFTKKEPNVIDLTEELVLFETLKKVTKKKRMRNFRKQVSISPCTVYRWMITLGYKYCTRKNHSTQIAMNLKEI